MIKKMKFVLLLLAVSQTFTMNISQASETLAARTQASWYVFDTVWYVYEPVYYTYTSDIYYYWDYWYYPSYWYVWRQDGTAATQNSKKSFSKEEAQKELNSLKKEIWGKEDFSTETIRKNKIYDPRWLMAQLKIARAINLEDMLNNNLKKNLRTDAEVEVPEKKNAKGVKGTPKREEAEDMNRTDAENEAPKITQNKTKTKPLKVENKREEAEDMNRTDAENEAPKNTQNKTKNKPAKVKGNQREEAEDVNRTDAENEAPKNTQNKTKNKPAKVKGNQREEAEDMNRTDTENEAPKNKPNKTKNKPLKVENQREEAEDMNRTDAENEAPPTTKNEKIKRPKVSGARGEAENQTETNA